MSEGYEYIGIDGKRRFEEYHVTAEKVDAYMKEHQLTFDMALRILQSQQRQEWDRRRIQSEGLLAQSLKLAR